MGNLLDKLKNNYKIPMHMPGHKRNFELANFLGELNCELDITEIDGFDNLAHPEDILKETMKKASRLWESNHSYLLVGGSTCGILAGIRSLTNAGDTVLMCRGSHKSVYHALELCLLKSQFIDGEIYNSSGKYKAINPDLIENELNNNPEIKLVLITSPLYEGEIQNIKAISKICHDKNIPLMVDEAHGSHLGFSDYFCGGAVKNGADLVVQSLHKTLLGFTQTGILHVCSDRVPLKKLEHNLAIFQTSSPSYLLLSSICECVDFIDENKTAFTNWQNILEKFYSETENLQHLKIINSEHRDKSKILIDCSFANIDGKDLMNMLREKYNIELEMAYANCALAMTGLGEKEANLQTLSLALNEIDKTLTTCEKESFSLENYAKNPEYIISKALEDKGKIVCKEEAVGKISANHLWVYPPGIPVIVAGEIITKEHINIIEQLNAHKAEILDTKGIYPSYIVLD